MLRIFAALAAALSVSLAAQAQTYPSKVVRLVVPFAPGGSSEMKEQARWGEVVRKSEVKAE